MRVFTPFTLLCRFWLLLLVAMRCGQLMLMLRMSSTGQLKMWALSVICWPFFKANVAKLAFFTAIAAKAKAETES